jgi:lysophospholipase L1-like esterase
VTRDYHQKVHAAMEVHPGVVFLGDSCTEFGTYPARTLQRLTAERATMHAGLHLASGGWSSEQGLAQLQRDVLPLHPHVVVIYFGWNDHWIALGPPDADLRAERGLFEMAEYSRLAQLLLKVRMGLSSGGDRPLRVPPDRYLHNLEEMSQLARQAGIMPVLVTAASNHVAGREPGYLLARHLMRLSDLVPLHQQYVSLTRRAATDAHAVLCDAAAAFDALPQPHAQYFRPDGIHFTERGDEELAGIVSRCIMGAVH